jgi:hypothetical protein
MTLSTIIILLDPEFPGYFTPENLTFDAVGPTMYHKVAECRTENGSQ